MSFKHGARVKHTSTTTGAGTLSLIAPGTNNLQGWNAVFGVGPVKVLYVIQGATYFEAGIGVFTNAGPTLSRDTILMSSAGGSAVSLPVATHDVFAYELPLFPDDVRTGSPTIALADLFGFILYTGTGGTASLPAIAGVPAGAGFPALNLGSGALTLDPNGAETINGAATLVLLPGDGAWIFPRTTATAEWTAIVSRVGGRKRNAQTGTTYTYAITDNHKHVTHNNAAAIAGTLPQASATTFVDGFEMLVENLGLGALTITPTTSTINGAATLVLTFGAAQAYLITSDGTNYRALPLYTPAASALDLNALTTDVTGGATNDLCPFVDASDANASNKVTFLTLFYNFIGNLTPSTSPDMATAQVMLRDPVGVALPSVLARYIGAGKQTIWVPAAAMTSRTTNGAASGTTESSTNKVMNKTFDFDTTTAEFAQFTVAFPKGWDEGTVTFVPYWTAASGSGTAIFSLAGVALSNDDAIDTAFGTAVTSTDTLITALDVHEGPESAAVTIGGTPAEGDLTYFQVARDVSDTLGVDAKLIGIKLFYTTNSSVDN